MSQPNPRPAVTQHPKSLHVVEAERVLKAKLLEAQRDIVWALINRGEAMLPLIRDIKATDFTDPNCRLLFTSMMDMVKQGETLGMLELTEYMDDKGRLSQLPGEGPRSGEDYIASLARKGFVHDMPSIVRRFRRIMASIAAVQPLEALSQDLKNRGGGSFEQLVGSAEKAIIAVKEASRKSAHVTFGDATAQIAESWEAQKKFRRIKTGHKITDRETGGLLSPGLVLLVGDPGKGKSTLVANWVDSISAREPVLFISIEMSVDENAARVLSLQTGFCESDILEGRLSRDQKAKLFALDTTQRLEFWADSAWLYDIEAIIVERAESGVKVFVVDLMGDVKCGKKEKWQGGGR